MVVEFVPPGILSLTGWLLVLHTFDTTQLLLHTPFHTPKNGMLTFCLLTYFRLGRTSTTTFCHMRKQLDSYFQPRGPRFALTLTFTSFTSSLSLSLCLLLLCLRQPIFFSSSSSSSSEAMAGLLRLHKFPTTTTLAAKVDSTPTKKTRLCLLSGSHLKSYKMLVLDSREEQTFRQEQALFRH